MGLKQISQLRQIAHLVADGGAGQGGEVLLLQSAAAYGLGGLDVILDNSVQDPSLAGVHHNCHGEYLLPSLLALSTVEC